MTIGANGVDYTALQTIWPTLTGTTAQKLTTLNAMTVTGSIPSDITVTGPQIYNCIVSSEFSALSAANQQAVRDIYELSGNIEAGTGTTVRTVLLALFGGGTTTRANFVALAKGISQPWWQANGYTAPINDSDLAAAGGLT